MIQEITFPEKDRNLIFEKLPLQFKYSWKLVNIDEYISFLLVFLS
jgi:hypothetical protein